MHHCFSKAKSIAGLLILHTVITEHDPTPSTILPFDMHAL
jgi:hypothetical protein